MKHHKNHGWIAQSQRIYKIHAKKKTYLNKHKKEIITKINVKPQHRAKLREWKRIFKIIIQKLHEDPFMDPC